MEACELENVSALKRWKRLARTSQGATSTIPLKQGNKRSRKASPSIEKEVGGLVGKRAR